MRGAHGYGYGLPSPRRVRADGVIWEADFTVLPLGALAYALPGGLLHTRASAATVQTGTSTVVTGLANDVVGIGRASDADVPALVTEEARTNILVQSRTRSAGWIKIGIAETPNQVGPDGSALAVREVAPGLGAAGYVYQGGVIGAAGQRWTGSGWISAGSAGAYGDPYVYAPAGVGSFLPGALSAAWERRSFVATLGAAGDFYWFDDFRDAIRVWPMDSVSDLAQMEMGPFPSEAIVTAGAAATRTQSHLYHPTGTPVLARGGRMGLEYRFRPKASSALGSAFAGFWNRNGANQAYIRTSTQKIEVAVAGATFVTGTALSWAANDTIDMWIEAGGGSLITRVVYRVNGGARVVLGESGAPQGTLADGAIDLFATGAQTDLSVRAERLRAYAPGRRPSWAA